MTEIFKRKWFQYWVLLITASPILSFMGGYGYFYVLALLFPLAQTIPLYRIKKSKIVLIWLLHFPFWAYVFTPDLKSKEVIILILISSILGELLLSIMFKKFGRFIWFFSNTIGLFLIVGGIQLSGSNDFIQVVLLILSFGVYAIISGIGLKYGFQLDSKTHYNKA